MNTTNLPEVTNYLQSMYHYYNGDLTAFINRCNLIFSEREKKFVDNRMITSSIDQHPHHYPSPTGYLESQPTYTGTTSPEGINLPLIALPENIDDNCFLLTIPIALATCSIIDIIGNLKKNNGIINLGTNENFIEFFKGHYDKVSINNASVLNWLFRQGLSHSYFPKHKLAIGYDFKNPKDKLFFKQDDFIILNVNYLTFIVKHIFVEAIEESKTNSNMQSRYETLLKYNKKDFDKNIGKLD